MFVDSHVPRLLLQKSKHSNHTSCVLHTLSVFCKAAYKISLLNLSLNTSDFFNVNVKKNRYNFMSIYGRMYLLSIFVNDKFYWYFNALKRLS